jgi:hypothetical protein
MCSRVSPSCDSPGNCCAVAIDKNDAGATEIRACEETNIKPKSTAVRMSLTVLDK